MRCGMNEWIRPRSWEDYSAYLSGAAAGVGHEGCLRVGLSLSKEPES